MERLEFWVDLLEASFLIGQYNRHPSFPPWPFVTTPSIDPLKNLKMISIILCTVNREIFAPCFFRGRHMYSHCVDFAFCEVGKK